MNPESTPSSLATMPIDRFLDQLASPSPTPGGGGVAALGGALAAGLISMVCHLTLGKEKYAAVQDEVGSLLASSDELRRRLHAGIEADARAYDAVMAAYRLPRATDQEKAARSARIQEAIVEATRVPLATARDCARVVDQAIPAARITNTQALGDVAMAAYLAEAAVRGLVDNVDINLRPVKDPETVRQLKLEAGALLDGLREKVETAIRESMARA